MAQSDRNYSYLIITDDGNVYGTDDDITAEKASEDDGHIVIATKSGIILHTGKVASEYPLYEELEDDGESDDDI